MRQIEEKRGKEGKGEVNSPKLTTSATSQIAKNSPPVPDLRLAALPTVKREEERPRTSDLRKGEKGGSLLNSIYSD